LKLFRAFALRCRQDACAPNIWGKQDGLIPVTDADRFNKGIANSQLVVFDNCGHIPQFEKAADFNKQVLEFLRK
jgi:pimeloyl-ACP methyl ester carboxylesterase